MNAWRIVCYFLNHSATWERVQRHRKRPWRPVCRRCGKDLTRTLERWPQRNNAPNERKGLTGPGSLRIL
jgi:hypothetical protein